MPWMIPIKEYTKAYISFLANLCIHSGLQTPRPHVVLVSVPITLELRSHLSDLQLSLCMP